MKLLLENWRKYLAENRKTGTLNSDYPGYVEVYSPYSEDQKIAHVGVAGDQVEILGSWSDKGMRWLEVDVGGTKGWIAAGELTMDEVVDKDSMPCNKPRTTQSHKGKSHVVKACADGKEKVIPFGEKGASTAGAPKKGESDKMKKKRKSFKSRHAKNIKKGKMSAAYWADKVKW
tara:strand:- start:3149 stop:3670 length:522 start_codon:yes stop_codon:yes gene_type:complete